MTSCFSKNELSQFVLGAFDDQKSETIELHLEECARCLAVVGQFDQNSDSLVFQLANFEGYSNEDPLLKDALDRAMDANRHTRKGTILSSDPIGEQIGEYRILSPIASGGMGRVYRAIHTSLGKSVAIKVLPSHRMQCPEAIARFTREMKIVGKMSHPGMVSATDAGKSGEVHYLVMELVDGIDLGKVAKYIPDITSADACEIIRQAALAIQYGHEQGVIHRDIKPSNIMLGRDGSVKILDLGLATLQGLQGEADQLTTVGQLMGTLDFMPPEQCGDQDKVDERSDIYGLAATLYKLLSGNAPYDNPKWNTPLKKIKAFGAVDATPLLERNPSIPEPITKLVDQCLKSDPGERIQSGEELAKQIAPFATEANLSELFVKSEKALPHSDGVPNSEVEREFSNAANELRGILKAKRRRKILLRSLVGVAVVTASIIVSIVGVNQKWFSKKYGTVVVKSAVDGARISLQRKEDFKKFGKARSISVDDDRKSESLRVQPGKYDVRLLNFNVEHRVFPPYFDIREGETRLVEVVKSPPERHLYQFDRRSRRPTQMAIDVNGVGSTILRILDKRLQQSQITKSITSDGKSIVLAGKKRDVESFYEGHEFLIRAHSSRGIRPYGIVRHWYYDAEHHNALAYSEHSDRDYNHWVTYYHLDKEYYGWKVDVRLPGPCRKFIRQDKMYFALCETSENEDVLCAIQIYKTILPPPDKENAIPRGILPGKRLKLLHHSETDGHAYFIRAGDGRSQLWQYDLNSMSVRNSLIGDFFKMDQCCFDPDTDRFYSWDGKKISEYFFDPDQFVFELLNVYQSADPLDRDQWPNIQSNFLNIGHSSFRFQDNVTSLVGKTRSGRAYYHPSREICAVVKNQNQKTLVSLYRISSGEKIGEFVCEFGSRYEKEFATWLDDDRFVVACGEGLRIIDATEIAETIPAQANFAPLKPSSITVGQQLTVELGSDLPGDVIYRVAEGKSGANVQGKLFSWVSDSNSVGKNIFTLEASNGKQTIQTLLEVDVRRPYIELPDACSWELSSDGQTVVAVEGQRNQLIRSLSNQAFEMLGQESTYHFYQTDSRQKKHVLTVAGKHSSILADRYFFVFYPGTGKAERYDILKEFNKTKFEYQINQRLYDQRTPFAHFLLDSDLQQIVITYEVPLKKGFVGTMMGLRKLNMSSLTLSEELRQQKNSKYEQSTYASYGDGQFRFCDAIFDESTGKVIHNLRGRWFPILTLDKEIANRKNRGSRQFNSHRRIRDSGLKLDFDKAGKCDIVVAANLLKGNKEQQYTLAEPHHYDRESFQQWQRTQSAIQNKTRIQRSGQRLFCQFWNQLFDVNVADAFVDDQKKFQFTLDGKSSQFVFSTDVMHSIPLSTNEAGDVKYHYRGTSQHITIDENSVKIDAPTIMDDFARESLCVCLSESHFFNNHNEKTKTLYDNCERFKLLTGVEATADCYQFVYPFDVFATNDAQEEAKLSFSVVLLVPKEKLSEGLLLSKKNKMKWFVTWELQSGIDGHYRTMSLVPSKSAMIADRKELLEQLKNPKATISDNDLIGTVIEAKIGTNKTDEDRQKVVDEIATIPSKLKLDENTVRLLLLYNAHDYFRITLTGNSEDVDRLAEAVRNHLELDPNSSWIKPIDEKNTRMP